MPKSDTWPGGTGVETLAGMGSAESCDSITSGSDDSLEHLSAEEKACLMFLEETIESLETEEDSELSNDEADHLPAPGNVASKVANLSASMNGQHASDKPRKDSVIENKLKQSYLVGTPLVLGSGSPCSRAGLPTTYKLCPRPELTEGGRQRQKQGAAPASAEVRQAETPPQAKAKDLAQRTAEAPPLRGPLSYEALLHLRRSASAKKTPLCPKVDHTIEGPKTPDATVEGILSSGGNLSPSPPEPLMPKAVPPAVPPKPKVIPPGIPVRLQPQTTTPQESASTDRPASDPQRARREALQKPDLLDDPLLESDAVAPLPGAQSPPPVNPLPDRFVRDPISAKVFRIPAFSYVKVPAGQRRRPLQISASFHHYARDGPHRTSAHVAPPRAVKTTNLERSATLDSQRTGQPCPDPRTARVAEPAKTATKSPPVPPKPLNYGVKLVPGMTADRREALRKLGLLKD